jgi:hypothetical protein
MQKILFYFFLYFLFFFLNGIVNIKYLNKDNILIRIPGFGLFSAGKFNKPNFLQVCS